MPGRLSPRLVCRDTTMLLLGVTLGVLLARYHSQSASCELSLSKKQRQADDPAASVHASTAIQSRAEPSHPVDYGASQKMVLPGVSQSGPRSKSGPRKKTLGVIDDSSKIDTPPLVRPKTLGDELNRSMRKTLFIGVVTAQELLQTRAVAVNQTWGSAAPALVFFSSLGSANYSLPVVSLPDVDDTYPPQKKVFRMLKYMHDKHIDDYNWFMRADDDIYVRVEALMYFLSKLDPSKELYIGQPGSGKVQDRERLKLLPHEHYCMGGPGVIFSRALLKKLAPHLEDCLQNVVVSYNEDVEVGRCISRRLGVQCTWNYEMSKLFYMDYSKGEVFLSSSVYKNKHLLNALTVHSFKDPDMMHRIHQFYIEMAIGHAEARIRQLKNEQAKVSLLTGRTRAFP